MPQTEPILETARLRLRPHGPHDFPLTLELWGDARVTPFLGGKPHSREQSWTRFLRYLGLWQALGFGYWIVEEKATGAFVGEVGFGDFKRDSTPDLGAVAEIGWVLSPGHYGKGYACEAAQACLDWASAHVPDRPVCCVIAPANTSSIRVAQKLGFRQTGTILYGGQTINVYAP